MMSNLLFVDRVVPSNDTPATLSSGVWNRTAQWRLQPLRLWQIGWIAQKLRKAAQAAVLAAVSVVAPSQVLCEDRLDGLAGPVIFAANHTSHLDTPVLLRALPARWRGRVAVAAAQDYFFRNRLVGGLVRLLFNAFPVSRSGFPRSSLERCRRLLRDGWSLVIYPEGTRSRTGDIVRFKAGVGLLAVASGVPVVPLRTDGLNRILPPGRIVARRGRVIVWIGTPRTFAHGVSASEAAAAIEAAVRNLGDHPEHGQGWDLTGLRESAAITKGQYSMGSA